MLDDQFFGNTVAQYSASGGAFLVMAAGILLLRRFVFQKLRAFMASRADIDRHIVDLASQIHSSELAFLAFYLCTRPLALPHVVNRLLHILLILVLSYRGIKIVQDLAAYLVGKMVMGEETADASRRSAVRNITYLTEAVVWVGGLLFALENLGVNISAMVAGLGITGVAVALAAQAILSDLFSAVAIYLDRPFVPGDSIAVDAYTGTVERIGIKTTRVRSDSGEMLVFSNSFLTSAKIRNFQQLRERVAQFSFGVSYRTPSDKVAKVPALVRDVFSGEEKARLERVHLKRFGDSGLEFEVAYRVLDRDFGRYMDVNQRVHLGILQAFRSEGIAFAHPTRTVVSEAS